MLNSKSSFYEVDVLKRVLGEFKPKINNILEVGCSNGVKLAYLCDYFDASGVGIEPSFSAVESGNARFAAEGSKIKLQVGTADKLSFENAAFDLVHFGFCLYLVDRADILKVVAEADRVLKSGGFLTILDFDPATKHKRPYHHKPGLFSYKTSHADFFTSGGHYYLVAKESFSHSGNYFTEDSDERVSVSVLYKEPDPYYNACL